MGTIEWVKPPKLITKPLHTIASEAEAIAAAQNAAKEIAALAKDHSLQKAIPWRQAEILSRSGITAIAVPQALGGLGASIATIVETVRIISTADGGIGQLLQIHNVMLRGVFARPDNAFRTQLLADIFDGKRFGHAGAETGGKTKFDHKTTAQRNAEGKWVVNGHKFYTTGSHLAEWISAGAKTPEGDIGFLVNRNAPGVFLDDDWDAFGQQHSVSGSVRFVNLVLEDYQVSIKNNDKIAETEATESSKPAVRTNLTWAQILHAAIDTGIARGVTRLQCARPNPCCATLPSCSMNTAIVPTTIICRMNLFWRLPLCERQRIRHLSPLAAIFFPCSAPVPLTTSTTSTDFLVMREYTPPMTRFAGGYIT